MTSAGGAAAPKPVYLSFSLDVSDRTVDRLLWWIAVQLEAKATEFHLLISTFGGSVEPGMNAYNILRGLPVPLTTHNVGSVQSIGNLIFLAGRKRFAAPQSTFFFHGTTQGSNVSPDVVMLRRFLANTELTDQRTAQVIHSETAIPLDEVKQLLADSRTIDADAAKALGIVHEIRRVQIPPDAIFIQVTPLPNQ